MRVGIAADHGGFILKERLAAALRGSGHELIDFGSFSPALTAITPTSSSRSRGL
ncbi:MAG: hypothetical protein Q7T24_02885 [Deltaproteobacteria bacterium]|nr:hypothetical protein [Deltaproteobacteria bacterium]